MIQQQQHQHSLSTVIPHPSVTLQQSHSSSRDNSSNMLHQDGPTSPIDFTNSNALFMSPLSRASQLDDFEDLDYQSGLASYQKQHLGLRHPAMPNPMDIHPTTASSTIPIHPSMKQDTSSFYPSNNDYDPNLTSFPMSAPANIGHFGGPSFSGGDPQVPTTSTSSLLIHPQQHQQHQQQQHHHPQPMDSPGSTARSFEEDDYSLQMNMQLMMDKRRRRRESHNAVERRRRENINERIQELGTLLPEIMAEPNTANNKPNKGAILRHSVDHIRQLQQQVHSYSQRVKELETTLARLQSK